jgi:hypothetical protein
MQANSVIIKIAPSSILLLIFLSESENRLDIQ